MKKDSVVAQEMQDINFSRALDATIIVVLGQSGTFPAREALFYWGKSTLYIMMLSGGAEHHTFTSRETSHNPKNDNVS